MKGGCSPQNNCGNIRRLLDQRPAHDNQAFAGFSRDTSAVIRNPSFEGANQSKEGETRREAKSAPGHQAASNAVELRAIQQPITRCCDSRLRCGGDMIQTHEQKGDFRER
jgi:hypothetical protein